MSGTLDEISPSRQPRDNLSALVAEPLPGLEGPAFGRLFDRYAKDARVVLLGEASHGMSEFYRARAEITRWLIERRGFSRILATPPPPAP
jgi:erythromycin esterase-like protein